jgi:predicted nucleotidyltransferase component of viral defense system
VDALTIARDRFQQRLLTQLFKAGKPEELVLKGGAAMRVVMGDTARFTQDLDLDHDPKRSLASLQNLVRRAIEQSFAGSAYRKLAVSEPKQTAMVARWKLRVATATGQEFQLTIEVSRRHPLLSASIQQKSYQSEDKQLPRVYVDIYTESTLIANKLRALIDENRFAPRDIYDLDLLIARGERAPEESLADLQSRQNDLIDRLAAKLDAMPWSLFQSEALPALPDDLRPRITEQEYEAMKLRILEEAGKWIAELPDNHQP